MTELLWPISSILAGLVALLFGGEILVRGASLLALSLRISPLVIGLTVIAFGTSAPELGVSLQATMNGAADVAIGNVVGSNICNVLLILGISALVTPLVVSSQLIRWDVPVMITVSFVLWGFCWDLRISQIEGAILFFALVLYVFFAVRSSRDETAATIEEFAEELPAPSRWTNTHLAQLGLILGGLVALGFGSNWLVSGAVSIAKMWNISELIIGLTIVAIGTSLPEIVTSVIASLRGQRDIAVGNVVGSNLFNILCVLGLTGIITPAGVPISIAALEFDIPVMVAVSAICLPIFFTGSIISRTEGAALVFYYLAYTGLLVSEQTHPQLNLQFGWILSVIVLPMTLLTIFASVLWSWYAMRRASTEAT